MAITHTFAGSRDYGYYAFIENGELVIGENWPHEGGEIYRGTFFNATKVMRNLEKENVRLYNSITKYYETHSETNTICLAYLKPGDRFSYNGKNYIKVDMEISKCFVFGDQRFGDFVTALDLNTYKIFCLPKKEQVTT